MHFSVEFLERINLILIFNTKENRERITNLKNVQ